MGFEHWEVGFGEKNGLGNGIGTPSGPSSRDLSEVSINSIKFVTEVKTA